MLAAPATIGIGGSSHINMVLFESMTGTKLTPVHYRGGAPLVTDLLGCHVPMSFLSGALVESLQDYATMMKDAEYLDLPSPFLHSAP